LQLGWVNEALENARKAVSLDEADAIGHAMLGYTLSIQGQHDLAGLHLERAIALNPMDVRITSKHALWLTFTGRGDEAVRSLDADLRRDPFPPAWFWAFRGIALFQGRQYEAAIEALSRLPIRYYWDDQYLAASYAQLGLMERARECVKEILKARPDYALGQVRLIEPYKYPADLERLIDGLRKAGLPE
jgi:tetratricopeptide (TPR) repeat protein